jgi:hypothetical protein
MIFHVNEFEFINKRFMGFGIESTILSWLVSNAFYVLFFLTGKSVFSSLKCYRNVTFIP